MKPLVTPEELKLICRLTARQYQVFCLLGEGKTREEITNVPGYKVSGKTIDAMICNIKEILCLPDVCKVRALGVRFNIYCEQNCITRSEVSKTTFELVLS